jgi:predicted dehydrogenase
MLKGALVGFGGVAQHGHWPAYATSGDAAIVAVVDRTAERRAIAASLAPSMPTYATLDELGAVAPIDFVDICTPPAFHPQPMLDAIARGWHVLCEKPLLLDPEILGIVRTRAADAGVAVMPVHNWKYAPIVSRATATLRAGAIGSLRRVEIETCRVRDAATADPARPNWRRDPAVAGGGILMDHGWHAIYLALHWFGQAATSVGASLHQPARGGVEDEASVTITFPAGEAVIRLTWNAAERRNAMRLVGDDGEIVIADDTLRVSGATEPEVFARPLSAGSHHADWFAAMLPEVVAAFKDPGLATPAFEQAAQCLTIIQQAYQSDLSFAHGPVGSI